MAQGIYPNLTAVGPDTDPDFIEAVMAANITAVGKNNAANIAKRQGRYAEAVTLHREAIDLKVRAFGEESVQAALSFNALGEVFLKMNKLDEAEEYLKKSLKVRDDRAFGGLEMGPRIDAAASRDNVARLLEARGNFDEAREIRLRGAQKGRVICGSDQCVTPGGALLSRDQLKRCAACNAVFYCGQICQRQDWSSRHKPLCKAYVESKKAASGTTATGS